MDDSLSRRDFGVFSLAGLVAFHLPTSSSASTAIPNSVSAVDLQALFENAKTIQAKHINFVPELVQTTKPTIIWADTINISGKYHSKGQPILIVAREIYIEVDSLFNTNGLEGQPDFRPENRAADGRQAGQAGANGNTGGTGQDGGLFMIYANQIFGHLKINSSGGAGGRGQNGGNGARGASRGKAGNCRNGARGGTGGQAGSRGLGGNGGNAGSIIIHTISDEEVSVSSTQLGGESGRVGLDGARGAGGGGGAAGNRTYTRFREGGIGER